MQYTVTDDSAGYTKRVRHPISQEGADILYAAYVRLYGRCQTQERIQERGGIFADEVTHWIEKKALPADFDWKQYIIKQ